MSKVYLQWSHIEKMRGAQTFNWGPTTAIHWPVRQEVLDWLEQNCKSKFVLLCDDNGTDLNRAGKRRGVPPLIWSRPYFWFADPEEAMMFRLTWF